MDIFDILGPVMVGPSSSHTAGAARIGAMARTLLGEPVTEAKIHLYGSFAETGRGHGTDRALVAGLLGMKPDDLRIPSAFEEAARAGLRYTFDVISLRDAHPNTAVLEVQGVSGKQLTMQAASLGGGRIEGIEVSFTGMYSTLIVRNQDEFGSVAGVTNILSQLRINVANMSLSRQKRGGDALMVIEIDQHMRPNQVQFLAELPGILSVTYYDKEDEEDGAGFNEEVVLADDMEERQVSREASMAKMLSTWQAMQDAADAYTGRKRSVSGLVGGDGMKMRQYNFRGCAMTGGYVSEVIAEALSMAESNACMRRIVAAPTAGACGVLPAVLLPLCKYDELAQHQLLEALYVAAGIGAVIAFRASIAGASGGCQAEIGTASAMAAGALVALRGGSGAQIGHAVAMALKNLLGLVCDPVAGLVEVPCVKRNVIGAVNAVSAADMALAGIESRIPVDEVIDAMGEVGRRLPVELKETALGGLAATPTGERVKRDLQGGAQAAY